MRATYVMFAILAGIATVAVLAPHAQASTDCNIADNACQGFATAATTTGSLTGARCFFWRVTNTAPTCPADGIPTSLDESTWQMDAGACLTTRYWRTVGGTAPPAAPNKVTLALQFDNTGTPIATYRNAGTEPANGDTFSVCATTDGTSGGSPRAGTYRLLMILVKDDAIGDIGEYNINSDGGAAVGVNTHWDKGALRGRMKVTAIDRSAYPSGSTFAFGPASDESVTVTTTHTQPNGDANLEALSNAVLDSATGLIGETGAPTDADSTSFVQSFVVDSTFPAANSPYKTALTIPSSGLSALTGLRWTTIALAGNGASLTRVSDSSIMETTTFNIDPTVRFDRDGTGAPDDLAVVKLGSSGGALTSVFNRGETYYAEWYAVNARSQLLSRAMTYSTQDNANLDCTSHGSLTPTANKYTVTVAIPTGGSCAVAATDAGSNRHLRGSGGGITFDTATAFAVSTLFYVDAHTQIAATLNPDDYPTENANEATTFTITDDGAGGDASDTMRLWCHLKTVRKDTNVDTSGSAIAWSFKDPTTTTRASGTTDTGADGWTPTSLNLLASTPLGTWVATCTGTFNGNSGTYAQNVAVVVEGGGGGGPTINTLADPLTVFGGDVAYEGEAIPIAVTSRFLDGEARTGAAASIFVTIYAVPGLTAVVTDATVTEAGAGAYIYEFTPPENGPYLIVANTTDNGTLIGASNVVVVRGAYLEMNTMSDFGGLGFDGLLLMTICFAAMYLAVKWGNPFMLTIGLLGIPVFLLPAFPIETVGWILLLAFSLVVPNIVRIGRNYLDNLRGKTAGDGR